MIRFEDYLRDGGGGRMKGAWVGWVMTRTGVDSRRTGVKSFDQNPLIFHRKAGSSWVADGKLEGR